MPKNLNSSNRHDQDLSEQMNVQMNIYVIELPSSDETSFTNEDFESSSQQTCGDDLDYQPEQRTAESESQGPPAKKPRTRSSHQEISENSGSSSSDHDSDVEQEEPGILDADNHHAGFFLPLFASLHKL